MCRCIPQWEYERLRMIHEGRSGEPTPEQEAQWNEANDYEHEAEFPIYDEDEDSPQTF